MAKDLDDLASEYESALAAHQDDPDDARKRTLADRAGSRLAQARSEARSRRGGVGVVTATPDELE